MDYSKINKNGLLQYIPNESFDFKKKIQVKDFDRFRNEWNSKIIVSERMYNKFKEFKMEKNFETLGYK